MHKLIFVAAALAAGGYGFAADAATSGRGESLARPKAGIAGSVQPDAAKSKKSASAKVSSAKKAVSTKKAGVSAAKPARAKSARATAKVESARRGKPVKLVAKVRGKSPAEASVAVLVNKTPVSGHTYSPIITRYATSYGVPVSLAHAVISIESSYRADARGSAGEIGLMQIKPATARMMGYTGSAQGLFHPETNIRYGMKYLGMAHKLGGGATCGTILRYNAGHAATRMNPISSAYCSKVKRQMAGA